MTHYAQGRGFLRGQCGETISLWTLLREIGIYSVLSLLDVLKECEQAPTLRLRNEVLPKVILNAGQALLDLGLSTSVNLATDFIAEVKCGNLSDVQFSQTARNLSKAIELESFPIVCYRNFPAFSFNKNAPFGAPVTAAFPNGSEDIREAHECFQFARYTACAFHVGRAMELAVQRVAEKLKARPARKEWQHYVNEINAIINKMPFNTPKQKEKRAKLSAVSNYLFNFKEAWRNPTMHPKKTYTSEQAQEVLASAGSFLKYAAEHIFNR